MMTSDLKMNILHFNRSSQQLEIISSYKVDVHIMGGGGSGKSLKEVSFISYD